MFLWNNNSSFTSEMESNQEHFHGIRSGVCMCGGEVGKSLFDEVNVLASKRQ